MRKSAYKSYRVDKQHASAVGKLNGAGGYIQCGEKLVFRKYSRIGESVEKSGLPHVGISHYCRGQNVVFFAAGAVKFTAAFKLL